VGYSFGVQRRESRAFFKSFNLMPPKIFLRVIKKLTYSQLRAKRQLMKLTPTFVSSLILMFGSLSPSAAQFISGPNIKTVYSQVVVNGLIATQAVRTTVSTDISGNITAKRQTEVIVPDGAGGFTKSETRETTTAALSGGSYTVVNSSVLLVTALDALKVATGTPVESYLPANFLFNVSAANLNLPASTEFAPIDVALDAPINVSQP
jgi:hypothetical protein